MKSMIAIVACTLSVCAYVASEPQGGESGILPLLSYSELPLSSLGLATSNAVPEARYIRDLMPYEDKLYIGHGNAAVNTGPTDVIYWDFETSLFVTEFTVDDEAIANYEVLDNILMITGTDATEDWSFGNVYVHSTNGWVKYRTVPNGIHVFSAASLKDRWYISIAKSIKVTSDSEEAGAGVILSSVDQGKTWIFEYASAFDIYAAVWNTAIIHYNKKLYSFTQAIDCSGDNGYHALVNYTGQNDTIIFDGNNWFQANLISDPDVYDIRPFVVGDYLGLSASFCKHGASWPPKYDRVALYRYDGENTYPCQLEIQALHDVEPTSDGALMLIKTDNKWAVAETKDLQDIDIQFLPKDIQNPVSVAKIGDTIYIGTSDGYLYTESTD